MRFTGASRTVVGTGVVAALALSAAIAPARPSSAAPPAGVSATISAPGFPAIVAAGYGSVWIAGHRNGVLYRVNPRTNRVTGKLQLPGPINGSLTLAGGVVWADSPAPDGSAAYVYRIDPWKMRILGRHEGVTVAVAANSWWVSSFQQPALLRIKPSTRRVVARITKFGVNPAARVQPRYRGRTGIRLGLLPRQCRDPDQHGHESCNRGDPVAGVEVRQLDHHRLLERRSSGHRWWLCLGRESGWSLSHRSPEQLGGAAPDQVHPIQPMGAPRDRDRHRRHAVPAHVG